MLMHTPIVIPLLFFSRCVAIALRYWIPLAAFLRRELAGSVAQQLSAVTPEICYSHIFGSTRSILLILKALDSYTVLVFE